VEMIKEKKEEGAAPAAGEKAPAAKGAEKAAPAAAKAGEKAPAGKAPEKAPAAAAEKKAEKKK